MGYPGEVVYAADRKSFHKGCITCQVRGCGNELTERGLFKHEGYNVCGQCYETLDERRRRLAREQEEREKRMEELKAQRNKDNFGDIPQIYCMKIAEICEIAPVKEFTI